MPDYSGALLHGTWQMGPNHVFEVLHYLTCDPAVQRRVERLGTAWGHAVVPSTPV